MKFCSISGILLGQFSAGQLEHSVKPFGTGRGTGLRTLRSGQPALLFSLRSCPLPSFPPAILRASSNFVL